MARITRYVPEVWRLLLHMNYATRITIGVLLILAIFSVSTFADETNVFLRTDQRLFDSIYDEPPEISGLSQAMEGITTLCDTSTVLSIALAMSAFGDERMQKTGKLMTTAIVGTGGIIYCMKIGFGRPRPLENQSKRGKSFPSGHTGFAFSMATVLGHQYPEWRIPFYFGATLVGTSRIYLGKHYPSDVLVGSLIGTLVGWQVTEHKVTILKWEF